MMKMKFVYLGLLCCLVFLPVALAQDDDGDGIPNSQDQCPNEKASGNIPTSSPFYGCADRDGDGVADLEDACPDQAGIPSLKGCAPDRDGDGIPDDKDACPDTPARGAIPQTNKYYGCVDIDFDGIADIEDICPNETGTLEFLGCKKAPPQIDKDQDGVLDVNDVCPTFPGEVSNDGCSLGYDRDGDGVPDGDDRCKKEKGLPEFQGCPTGATSTPTATAAPNTNTATATPTLVITNRTTLPLNPAGCVVMPNVANRAVNVRQNPDEGAALLRSIPDSQTYSAIAQSQDSQARIWYALADGGWVASWVLDSAGNCAALPQQATSAIVPTASTVLAAPQVESVVGGGDLPALRTPLNTTNAPQVTLLTQQSYPTTAQILLDGMTVLVDNGANTLQRYDLSASSLTPQDSRLENPLNLLALNPRQYVTSALTAEGYLLSVVDLSGQAPPLAWRLDSNQAFFNAAGSWLVAHFYNGTMASSGTSVVNFLSVDRRANDRAVEYQGMVIQGMFHPDGSRLVFHSIDQNGQNFITIIDPANPTNLLQNFPTNANNTNEFGSGDLVFNADGSRLALGTVDGAVQIWDTQNWAIINTFTALPNTMIRAMAFDPSGAILAVGGGIPPQELGSPVQNTAISLLEVATGLPLTTLGGHSSFVQALHFTPDGALLVSASDNGELKIWGIRTP